MSVSPDGKIKVGALGIFCIAGERLIIGNYDGISGDDLLCNNPSFLGSTANMVMLSNGTAFNSANPDDILGRVQLGIEGACEELWCNDPLSQLFTGDFNGDGKTDLLCNIVGTNKIMLSALPVMTTMCAFAPIQTKSGPSSDGTILMGEGQQRSWCNTTQSKLVVGDIDGNKLSDLVCNLQGTNKIMLCKSESTDLYKFESFNSRDKTGDGTVKISEYNKWCTSQNLFIGDFNFEAGQRRIDDLWCNQYGSVVGITLENKNGILLL
jgi:hypothetical protein